MFYICQFIGAAMHFGSAQRLSVVKNKFSLSHFIPHCLLIHYGWCVSSKYSRFITNNPFFFFLNFSLLPLINTLWSSLLLVFRIQSFEFWFLYFFIFHFVKVLFVYNWTIRFLICIYNVFRFNPSTFNFLFFCFFLVKIFMAFNFILQIKFIIFVFSMIILISIWSLFNNNNNNDNSSNNNNNNNNRRIVVLIKILIIVVVIIVIMTIVVTTTTTIIIVMMIVVIVV